LFRAATCGTLLKGWWLILDEIILVAEQEEAAPDVTLATVAEVTATGVRIQIDGEDAAGLKEYQCNTAQPFAVGDRVKISPVSGSFLVEYKIGAPGATYPIPAGGTDGQVLTKDGSNPYAVKWASTFPSGGNTGDFLKKTSSGVAWGSVSQFSPTGSGTAGQFLKKTASAYEWADAPAVPAMSSSTSGKYLTNNGITASWGDAPTPTPTSITNGNYTLSLSNTGVLAAASSSRKITLGTTNIPFTNLYVGGSLQLGTATSDKIGFFGHALTGRQTVSSTATVATLITALKAYGLIA
jgi:hypothetical protein